MTTPTLITTARTLLSELQHRRTLAIAAGQRSLSDALLTFSVEYETLLGKLEKIYPEPEPEQGYLTLKAGDIVQNGDEWKSTLTEQWRPVESSVGSVVGTSSDGRFRRCIIPPANMDTLCRFHAEQCGKERV